MWKQFNDLLEENHITVYRMARETGIDASQLSRWKNGLQRPNADNLLVLADYFKVSVDSLLRDQGNASLVPDQSSPACSETS